jgi:CheY-like chemotaxis protein
MKRRILLADDSVTIQKVIELTFMDEDYEVRAVSNGDEAVALLSEMAPDFVIADVHMPGANGYEVCRRAKQLRPGTPVLLLVGTFEPFDEAQARSVGADSFLKKPFDSQELLQRVEELIAAKTPVISPPTIPMPIVPPAPPAAPPEPFASDWGTGASSGLGGLGFAAPEPPPPAPAPAAAPDWNAAPWGGFELSPEPEPMAAPVPRGMDPEPFDREPSFTLEPEPDYTPPAEEPVFSLEETDSSFAIREDVFGAPSDLSLDEAPLDEAPQDRYLTEEPAAPAPAGGAGFTWNEEPEPIRFAEEEPAAAASSWSEPLEPAPAFEEAAAPEPEQPQWSLPEPAYPPAAGQPQYDPSPAAYAAPAAPAAMASTAAAAPANGNGHLSDEDVDRIARRVVELLGDRTVRDVAWEVIPDMAEVIIRDRLRELEGQVE